eukprot:CAMPEP_0195049646 /NCGR_PEP_ID=MMETSP0347-20130606/59277_1 /TAXON_ID=2932 /ORGANISM="Alexandrium fundyense, Strain CCMP1719" /LENGTH=40 /DNA_ID= /DNA_START= /DNA_END= /DNA_ORIENTATION=
MRVCNKAPDKADPNNEDAKALIRREQGYNEKVRPKTQVAA